MSHGTQVFKTFLLFFDWILVERSTAKTATTGGILLPEKSQGKLLQATVVALDQAVVALKPAGSGFKGKVERFNQLMWKLGIKFSQNVEAPEQFQVTGNYLLIRDDGIGKYVDWNKSLLKWFSCEGSCPFHWGSEIFHLVNNFPFLFYNKLMIFTKKREKSYWLLDTCCVWSTKLSTSCCFSV